MHPRRLELAAELAEHPHLPSEVRDLLRELIQEVKTPPTVPQTPSAVAAFWAKVDKSGDCWLWKGASEKSGMGYGQHFFARRNRSAHRISYELANGPIPPKLFIDHICRVRACVNPAHLRTVTVKQNNENHALYVEGTVSGVRGIYWATDKKMWRASFKHHDKRVNVGYFRDLTEATEALKAKRSLYHTHNDCDR